MATPKRPEGTRPVPHFEYANIPNRRLIFVPFALASLLVCTLSSFVLLMNLYSPYRLEGSPLSAAGQADLATPAMILALGNRERLSTDELR